MKLVQSFFVLCIIFTWGSLHSAAQSSWILRNSTDETFHISISQQGSHTLSPSDYTIDNNSIPGWLEDDQEVITVNRDSGTIPVGDTTYFNALLTANADTVHLRFRLIGTSTGSNLAYSVKAPGFTHSWFTDSSFHQDTTTLNGKSVAVKYKPEHPDTGQSRDVLIALHQTSVYSIDSSDFQSSNVLNVMAYNVQMLPQGITGLPRADLRSDLLPSRFSAWQDVVIFCEVFDSVPRTNYLIPAMANQGFSHHTTILNDPDTSAPVPTNGGVMIFSRWPIVHSDEIEYTECGPSSQDCLSKKGVKYAEIQKMDKNYHVFGTHMDAGGDQQDTEARRSQIGEIRQFIDAKQIPDEEPVIFGGDFNIDPLDSDSLYSEFIDSLNPVVPEPIGFYESTFSGDTGKIIDHVWSDSRHLLPKEATNNVVTFRSIKDTMWELSEFSDHRAAQGRFVFPDFATTGADTTICKGESLSMAVNTNHNVNYQWQRNGQELAGKTNASLTLQNTTISDTGQYSCAVDYQETYGTVNNNIVNYLYPNGAKTFQANVTFGLGKVNNCTGGISASELASIHSYPNPSNGWLKINGPALMDGQRLSVQLFDLQGELVKRNIIRSIPSRLDLRDMDSGTYLLQISSDANTWQEKVMIQ